jgi:diacylglycerol kinase family enzyme
MGLEAVASQYRERIIAHAGFLAKYTGAVYLAAALYKKREIEQAYRITLDGISQEGVYTSILVANQPYYGKGIHPAADAAPADGALDVYLIKAAPGLRFLRMASDYARGNYNKWPDNISHFRCKTISVSSDQIMTICIDGELFYDSCIEYEAIPHAVDFVCPMADASSAES